MKLEVVVETGGGVIIALSKGINFSWGDISWARKTAMKLGNKNIDWSNLKVMVQIYLCSNDHCTYDQLVLMP